MSAAAGVDPSRGRAPPDGEVAGVVLAAGASSRMPGVHKLLLPVGGEPLVRHAVRAALDAGLDPVLVVVGEAGDAVRAAIADLPVEVVPNPEFRAGLSTSLARAAAALPESARAVVVLLADEPEVATGAIRRIVTAWGRTAAGPGVEGRSAIVRARYDDRPGHPVLIATDRLSRLASRRVDRGLRDLFETGDPAPREVRVPGPAPADVDTEADYRALLARLRQQ